MESNKTPFSISEAISSRRSIRRFKSDPVSDVKIKELLTAAMTAPSACNTRPWRFVAVKNRKVLDKIAETCENAHMLKTAPLAVIVIALPNLQEDKCPGYFPQDCGAAIQNMLLKAVDLELGACWCGIWPRTERVLDLQEILQKKEVFDPSSKDIPFAVVAFGTADENPKHRGFFEDGKVLFID